MITVTYANMTKDGEIGKQVTNMHNACGKNILKILEIEVKEVVLEAWYSSEEENLINECVEFPRVSTRVTHIYHLLVYFTIVSHICLLT